MKSFSFILYLCLLPHITIAQNWTEFSSNLSEKNKIEYLKISHIQESKLPDLSEFKKLKGLNIHGVIGQVNNLKGVDKLKQLESLMLTGISFKHTNEILIQISTLKKLEYLCLSDVKQISNLPEEFSELKELKYLKLEMISKELNMVANFNIIARLESLEEIDFQGNFWKTFQGDLKSFKHHKKIKIIRIDGNCVQDEYLKELINSLSNINLVNEINC